MENLYIPKSVTIGKKKDLRLCIGVMTDEVNEIFKTTLNYIEKNGKKWLKDTIILLPIGEGLNFEGVIGGYIKDEFTFSLGRNLLMGMGNRKNYDYMFMLDSDELLAENVLDIFQRLININFQYKDGSNVPISIPIENMVDEKNSNLHFVTRLIPLQEGYKYVGRIHEQLVDRNGGMIEDGVTLHSNPCMLHLGYTKDMLARRKKYLRNKTLLLEELEEVKRGGEPLKVNLRLDYIYFNLMVTEYAEKNIIESLEWFKCLESEIKSYNIEKMFIQQGLLLGLQLYYFLEDFNGFYRLLDKYYFLNKLPETHYLKALIHRDCDELMKARYSVKEYWKLRDITVLSSFPKDLQMDNKVRELEKYLYK